MYRLREGQLEVLLVHPGGPFWKKKDDGAWTFPRGEVEAGEELESAARREFKEETSQPVEGVLFPLGSVRQKSGKVIHAWAAQGELDPANIKSNTFNLEWPPKSGIMQVFPEIDRAAFFDLNEAKHKIMPPEIAFLNNLEAVITARGMDPASGSERST